MGLGSQDSMCTWGWEYKILLMGFYVYTDWDHQILCIYGTGIAVFYLHMGLGSQDSSCLWALDHHYTNAAGIKRLSLLPSLEIRTCHALGNPPLNIRNICKLLKS